MELSRKQIDETNFLKEIKELFQVYAKNNLITVENIEIVGNLHNNFLSDVARVKITGNQDDPESATQTKDFRQIFIVKLLPKDEEYVNIYGCDIAFTNEREAYTNVIPVINKYSQRPIPAPKIAAVTDNVVILEDLNECGFYNFDKLTGFTDELIIAALSELANLHAASFTMRHKDPELFAAISKSAQEVLYKKNEVDNNPEDNSDETVSKTALLETQERSLDLMLAVLQKQNVETSEYQQIITDLKGRTQEVQRACLTRKGRFAVINHGDMWASNILRRDKKVQGAINKIQDNPDYRITHAQLNANKDDIKLIDFQIMRHTSLAADLNYFFYVNLPLQMKRNKMDFYLRYYLTELIDCITDCNVKKEIKAELTMDTLKEEMDEYSTYGFICGLWVFPVFYNVINMMVKTKDAVKKQFSIPIEEQINGMKDEEIQRLLGLMECYATSLREKRNRNQARAEREQQQGT